MVALGHNAFLVIEAWWGIYHHAWTGSSLIQRIGVKPLPKPVLTYHELNTRGTYSGEISIKIQTIYFKDIHSIVMSVKTLPFCSALSIFWSQRVHGIFRPQGVNSTVRARLAYGPHYCSQPIRFQSSKGLAVILVRTGKAHCPAASPVLSEGRQAGKCGVLVLYFCIIISYWEYWFWIPQYLQMRWQFSYILCQDICLCVCASTFSHSHTYLWNQHWFGLTHKLK